MKLIKNGQKVTVGGIKLVLNNNEMFDIIIDNYVK